MYVRMHAGTRNREYLTRDLQTRFDLDWEDGLEDVLAFHILDKHGHEISQQNGGLAVNLVERALR
jgi:hypothetical protein